MGTLATTFAPLSNSMIKTRLKPPSFFSQATTSRAPTLHFTSFFVFFRFITVVLNRHKEKARLNINRERFTLDRLVKFVALSGHTVIFLLHSLIPMPLK
jgi:hypothetical protein